MKKLEKMTQLSYEVPPTKLMLWYNQQPNRTAALRSIMVKTGVSSTLANNWVRGLGEAKREEHRQALVEITGIKNDDLFKLVE